jgi:voltage-gated potassium channel
MEYTYIFVRIFFTELILATPILLFLLFLIMFLGHIIGRVEGWSKSDAIYHAFINATTVGYGDLRPTKKLSKWLAIAIAVVGLVLFGIVIGIGLHAADYAFDGVYGPNRFDLGMNVASSLTSSRSV